VKRCTRRPGALGSLAVVAFALSSLACSHGPAADAIDDRNGARHFPLGLTSPPLARDAEVTPLEPGGRRPRAAAWRAAGVTADGRTLLVRFLADCGRLEDVTTEESAAKVRVTVRLSEPPQLPPGAQCGASPTLRVVEVMLRAPLRGRLVLDGADTSPRPVVPLR
jgi:hypothetical protein